MTPYKAFALRARGVRELLDIQSLIVELRPGVEIEIDLAPHPNFAGDLVIFTPPTRHMQRLHKAGKIDSFAVFFGGANVLHVRVERRVVQQEADRVPVRINQPQRPKAPTVKKGRKR